MRAVHSSMRIGELVQRSGVPARTIRYYESIGLLAPLRSDGGYRLFDHTAPARLDFIRKAQRLGLSLSEVRDIPRLRDGGSEPCAHVLAVLDRQIARVKLVEAELDGFAAELRRLRRDAAPPGKSKAAVCRIIEHASISDGRGLAPLLRGRRR